MDYKDITLAIGEHIATITLNKPEQLNAFTPQMVTELRLALEKLSEDDDVRLVILTGAGRAFCAGGNVKNFNAAAQAPKPLGEKLRESLDKAKGIQHLPALFRGMGKPAIAAVNGPAMGAGCDLSLMCDIRIAADTARFGESYVKIGLVSGAGGAYLLPRLVGLSKACELFFTGDTIDAAEAERIGLVSRVVPADQLMPETMVLAKRIAANPPLAVKYLKNSIYTAQESTLNSSLEYVGLAVGVMNQTEDHREAARAFVEKRAGHFRGM